MTRPPMLDNPRSDRIRGVAALGGRSARRRKGQILVEGPQAVRELVRHRPGSVVDVYMTDAARERDPDLAAASEEATRWVHPVTEAVSLAISRDSQGVAAVAQDRSLRGDTAAVWGTIAAASQGFVVCLPESQDPGNVGTIIRTADAMGALAVFLGPGTADPANPKVIRASAGSVFHIPLLDLPLASVRGRLGEDDWAFLATSGRDADLSLDDLVMGALGKCDGAASTALCRPHAWVIGNEARGLSAEDVGLCDLLVGIPIRGEAESLNASAAASMCLYASSLAAGCDR